MPTYLYQTVPNSANETAEEFEVRQGFNEEPLQAHPKTGVPVRRVISGGLGLMTKGSGAAGPSPADAGCGPGSCGCGKF